MKNIPQPLGFRIVAIVLLLWNLMGIIAFISDMGVSQDELLAMPENERAIYMNYPLWTKIAYGVAVFGGALGCVLWLLKKQWAKVVFIISLSGILVQLYHSLFMAKSMDVYGPGALIMPILVVLIGMFQIALTNRAIKKGWLH